VARLYRSAGTGLIGLGIVMGVVGAILYWAVTVQTEGFNINTIGLILLIVGIIAFVVGLIAFAMGSSRKSVMREDFRATPGGGHERVAEQEDRGIL
jgi:hypothetical protein